MENSAILLASVVLISMCSITITVTAIAINNLLSKYWKPIKFVMYESVQHEHEPTIETNVVEEKKKK
jgi:hypothetical protein